MTEMMVHSAVGESFSFPESKFNSVESENKSQILIGDNSELDENTIIFNDKMDSEKSSESTICGSNSKDSVVADDIQNSSSCTIKSNNIFREGFKYMATETTVINATYNVVSQSAVRGVKETPKIVNQQNPTSTVTDSKDESRVIVQILTDAKKTGKSQDAIKNKSAHIENQSAHSFRDDVFKILSKSQSSKVDIGNTSKEEIKVSNTLKVSEIFKSVSSQKIKKESTQIERNRRKRSLKSYFLFGGGPKIGDIENVSTNLHTATPNAIRIVHYVMYDKYGLCNSEMQIIQTRKNILHFCGYPFDQNSQEYAKRANCLKKIPRPILYEVHQAIFGETCLTSRTLMVQQLMEFFSKPKRYQKIVEKMKQNMQFMLEEEYNNLKETALRGPLPSVFLPKLGMDDVERIKNKIQLESKQAENKVENVVRKAEAANKPNYSLPAYILKGPGKKLKYFPAIVRNVETASEKDASLLHYILYGRIESESVVCKRNILEFSGFLEYQTDFIAERKATLIKLDKTDLSELCKILCLRGRTNSRVRKIEKIMEYLQSPFNPRMRGIRGNQKLFQKTSSMSKFMTSEPNSVNYSPVPIINEPEEAVSDVGLRLRDFKKICSNIECSAPSDLTELNDLLFIKPCDETEIHEKILNFTRFGFTDTSTQYHYRKTLMFYMGPCIVRKIAKLLDIEYWDNQVRSHEDLSSSILNFLMEKKNLHSLQARLPLSQFPVSSFNNSTETPKVQQHFQSAAFQHEANKSFACHKESVYIHRLTKSSVTKNLSSSANNALVPVIMDERSDVVSPTNNNFAEDDSIPLRVFIHHPTDLELKQVIHSIVKDDLWNITLGDLVQKVYYNYQDFNLSYRENFIKAEARQMISELRSDAFNVVQHMSFSHLPM